MSGKSRQGHSEDCRVRFERALSGDLKAQTARRRESEYLEKVLEAEDRKRTSARHGPPPSDRRAEGGKGGHDRRDEPQTCTTDELQISISTTAAARSGSSTDAPMCGEGVGTASGSASGAASGSGTKRGLSTSSASEFAFASGSGAKRRLTAAFASASASSSGSGTKRGLAAASASGSPSAPGSGAKGGSTEASASGYSSGSASGSGAKGGSIAADEWRLRSGKR